MPKRTVLIVDDELTLLRSLRDALRAQGGDLDVLTAGRADEALELMELTDVDLVVTDLRMPGQDGLSFIATVTHKYPKTRCILMTAHGDTETRNRSLSNGAVSFIEKPFDLDKFLSEVHRHLAPTGGFTGRSLVGFSLLDILQLVSMSQQSVTMTIRSGASVGSMYIQDGVLIHAETDTGKVGAKAAYEIVTWSDGDIASSRGVASDSRRTINIPLMNFLMEAAKYQDEAKRLKPVEDLKNVITGFLQANGILAVSVLFNQTGAEIYGESNNESIPRPTLGAGMVNAQNALRGAMIDSDISVAQELVASFLEYAVLSLPLLENRFSAVLCLHNHDFVPEVRELVAGKRGDLVSILTEYETQFDLQDGGGINLDFSDELESAFDSSIEEGL
ncbi:response regulator [Haliangium ochraceum]|uniref:Response regulator receiver protein n=1 Tax=Haliangium ochraceum (strain DSM 14365 / JCM 11303 / SMP-2) TaxID=502025 RepID=D0LUG8_HALO1|nr:response regulator [Haliangium ochraceum]ACY19291.1 response regulator receiver protein [Haliangium ochraceum DSM 14365]